MIPPFIYFLRPKGADGPIKIGCSGTPLGRLRSFMAWSPVPLELVATAPGDMELEQNIHECFAHCHQHGEWFKATPDLVAAVQKIAAGVPLCTAIDLSDRRGSIRKGKRRKKRPSRPPIRDDGMRAAINAVGSQAKLARALGVSPVAVTKWGSVPLARLRDVSRITGLPISVLRPDVVATERTAA